MRHKIKEISEVLFSWLSRIVQDEYDYTPPNLNDWSEKDWQVAKTIIFMHGMGPIWGYHITLGWTSKEMPEDVLNYLEDQFQENTKRIKLIQEFYQELCQKLYEAEIKFVPFKGIVMAEQLYPHIGCRPMADIDIYTGADCAEQVTEIMSDLDYVAPITSPGGITYYPKKYIEKSMLNENNHNWLEATENEMSFDGESVSMPFSVDVHFTMATERHTIKYNLTQVFEYVRLAQGRELSTNVTLVYFLLHTSKHIIAQEGRWIQMYDLYLIQRRMKIDPVEISAIGHELGVSHLLLLPFALCRKLFNTKTGILESRLEKSIGWRFRWLIEKVELSTYSTCNPSDALFSKALWTINYNTLWVGIKKSQKVESEYLLNSDSLTTRPKPFIFRMMIRIKYMIFSQTRFPWRLLAAHDIDPRKDWK